MSIHIRVFILNADFRPITAITNVIQTSYRNSWKIVFILQFPCTWINHLMHCRILWTFLWKAKTSALAEVKLWILIARVTAHISAQGCASCVRRKSYRILKWGECNLDYSKHQQHSYGMLTMGVSTYVLKYHNFQNSAFFVNFITFHKLITLLLTFRIIHPVHN